MILPCISACVPLHIDEGPPRHNTFSVVGLPLSLFCPPPPHRRYAADSRAFSAPPPVTLAVRGRFLMGGLPYYSVFPSIAFFRVFQTL